MDKIGAVHLPVEITGSVTGSLSGLTFAIKDNYALKGYVSGCGNPAWEASHGPEGNTASIVEQLLRSGAKLVAKTNMDELAFSITGENVHFGTPLNSAAPDRIPGGSSSGSASIVAADEVDFALGTDTAGSVRAPSSLCGLLGIRFSHGLLSMEGIVPLAHSFDVPGILAKKPSVFQKSAQILFRSRATEVARPKKLIILADAFALMASDLADRYDPELHRVSKHFDSVERVYNSGINWELLSQIFRIIQAYEAWRDLGDWISSHHPEFGPGIKERFQDAAKVTWWEYEECRRKKQDITSKLSSLYDADAALCMPTMPDIAPLRGQDDRTLETFRTNALKLLVFASFTGRPQVTWPIMATSLAPLGLSLVGFPGSDMHLLDISANLG